MSKKVALVIGACGGAAHYSALTLAKLGTHIIGTYDQRADNAEKVKMEIESCGACAAMMFFDANKTNITLFARELIVVLSENFGVDRIDNIVLDTGSISNLPYGVGKFDPLRFYETHVRIPHLVTEGLNEILAESGSVILLSSYAKRAS
ncbi:hypothetical protein C0V73_12885 [Rhizobium sp. TH135]|uniref:hypothetical protein n=1 Tax=Rhizobium sp. TH135 TaxID=2067451 RepID=UPI000C7DB835|nr:hypothetical protein [Rhizobium sp. TH135]PLK70270.1 hypothetical protein C0V73_12885 [Rhizobium sp. TH135]